MIAEDIQRMGRDGTRGDMEDGGQQFTGDLIHVRDHQQKTLRSSIGRRQSAGGQRAVNGAGSACLGLHLDDLDAVAEDVLTALRRPLVDIVGHRAGGGDGVDAGYFRKGVADMGGGGVAVHRLEFTCQNKYLLKVFLSKHLHSNTKVRICKSEKRKEQRKSWYCAM